jgi:hypothetical protein
MVDGRVSTNSTKYWSRSREIVDGRWVDGRESANSIKSFDQEIESVNCRWANGRSSAESTRCSSRLREIEDG